MIETIGWIGSILFAVCGVPQAWKSFKQKHSNGLSDGMLWAWFLGEILTMIYVYVEKFSWPLLFNYGCNFLCLLVIMYYRYWPDQEYELKQLLAEQTEDYINQDDYYNPMINVHKKKSK